VRSPKSQIAMAARTSASDDEPPRRKRSGFGDPQDVTQRWPSGIKDGAGFSIPTMQ
jgi:hypothetical protein